MIDQLGMLKEEGSIAQWIAYLLSDPANTGSNLGSRVFFGKIIDVAKLIDPSALLRVRVDSAKKL